MTSIFRIPLIREQPPKRINWSYDQYFQGQMAKIRALKAQPSNRSAFDGCRLKSH